MKVLRLDHHLKMKIAMIDHNTVQNLRINMLPMIVKNAEIVHNKSEIIFKN